MGILQTGQETDVILVSCTGSGIEPTRREQVLKAKRVSLFSHLFLLANSLLSVLYQCIELLAYRLGKIHWDDQALGTQLSVPVPSRYSFCSVVKLIIWSVLILSYLFEFRNVVFCTFMQAIWLVLWQNSKSWKKKKTILALIWYLYQPNLHWQTRLDWGIDLKIQLIFVMVNLESLPKILIE